MLTAQTIIENAAKYNLVPALQLRRIDDVKVKMAMERELNAFYNDIIWDKSYSHAQRFEVVAILHFVASAPYEQDLSNVEIDGVGYVVDRRPFRQIHKM